MKDRAQQAGEALTNYQDALKIVDGKLSEPISAEDKARLIKTQQETGTISDLVKELSKSQDQAVVSALKEFQEARKIEIAAGLNIDSNCPHDIE